MEGVLVMMSVTSKTSLRAAAVAVLAIVVLCIPAVSAAGPENSTAWSWAATSSYWNNYGAPITPTLVADPTGQRQGLALKVDFANWGWSFFSTDGAELFHFESGRDYTLLFDVFTDCEYACETDVRVVEAPCGCQAQPVHFSWPSTMYFFGDGEWHTVPVYIEDFQGPTGDYYLWFHDQSGCGCWLLGGIRQTNGVGHAVVK